LKLLMRNNTWSLLTGRAVLLIFVGVEEMSLDNKEPGFQIRTNWPGKMH
jgi:hypothetical protein